MGERREPLMFESHLYVTKQVKLKRKVSCPFNAPAFTMQVVSPLEMKFISLSTGIIETLRVMGQKVSHETSNANSNEPVREHCYEL